MMLITYFLASVCLEIVTYSMLFVVDFEAYW